MIFFTGSALVVTVLAIMAIPVSAQTAPPIQNGQVDILKISPRTTNGIRLEDVNDRVSNRTDDRGGRGGNDNSGPDSVNSGHGLDNSGPGSLNSGSGRGGDNNGRGGRDDHRVGNLGDVRQADRREDRREDRRANTGGELRGLDRADRVAGEHGREGRDNARAVQMDRPNRPERVELDQRPERLERGGRQGRH